METVRVRNSSGRDLDVRMPGGRFETVRAGAHLETIREHADALLEQADVWSAVRSAAKPPKGDGEKDGDS
jgi:hypothetical protein